MVLRVCVLIVPYPQKLCLLLVLNVQSTRGELCVLAQNELPLCTILSCTINQYCRSPVPIPVKIPVIKTLGKDAAATVQLALLIIPKGLL